MKQKEIYNGGLKEQVEMYANWLFTIWLTMKKLLLSNHFWNTIFCLIARKNARKRSERKR
jgi:hypothetical protein